MKSTNMGKTFIFLSGLRLSSAGKIWPAGDLYVAELQGVGLQIYSWDKHFGFSSVPRVIVFEWWEFRLFSGNRFFLARLTKKSRLFWLPSSFLDFFLLLILFHDQMMC